MRYITTIIAALALFALSGCLNSDLDVEAVLKSVVNEILENGADRPNVHECLGAGCEDDANAVVVDDPAPAPDPDEDDDKGHGNDDDHHDEDNPGRK